MSLFVQIWILQRHVITPKIGEKDKKIGAGELKEPYASIYVKITLFDNGFLSLPTNMYGTWTPAKKEHLCPRLCPS